MKMLSRADELVLLSVWRLNDNAYGVTIRKHIIEVTNVDWSVGAIYDSLEKLTNWDFLIAFESDPTPERGGRRKRFFKLTKEGIKSLASIKKVHETMWNNLPDIGYDVKL
jgi:PadR family transcriptional regulator, regulatory protein PadR